LNFQNEERVAFEKTCRELELQQLELEPLESKRKSILKAIVEAEGNINFWSSQTHAPDEDQDKAESLQRVSWKVGMHKEHLRKLQEMLEKLDRQN
jgi:hypothetical protein